MSNWKITFEVYVQRNGIQERRVSEIYAQADNIRMACDLFAETLWPAMQEEDKKKATPELIGAEYRVTSIDQHLKQA